MNPAKLNLLALPSTSLDSLSLLPKFSGVYLAIDGKGIVQYVGGTKNLYKRWRQHHKQVEIAQLQSAKIAYLSCPVDLVEEIETALIKWFQPPLNKGVHKYPVLHRVQLDHSKTFDEIDTFSQVRTREKFMCLSSVAGLKWDKSKGEILRNLRGNLSREELVSIITAKGHLCSHENLKKLEYGKSKSVSVNVLMAICDSLEVTLISFFNKAKVID